MIVVKAGGAILDQEEARAEFLDALARLTGPVVLVHGGGASANALLRRLGQEPVMAGGRRVTDAVALEAVVMQYAGWINKQLSAGLQARGVAAAGLAACDGALLRSVRRPVGDVDYGHVGDVVASDATILRTLLGAGYLPVVAPITCDGHGALLNTNADTVCAEIAVALARESGAAVTALFCFEHDGALRNPSDPRSRIPTLTRGEADTLRRDGTVSGGMLPKLDAAFGALDRGVARVAICAARDLPRAAGAAGACGTELVRDGGDA